MIDNPIINKLPSHLKSFIIPQNYERYTPQDQAVWRFVMRQNVNFLSKVAHKSYVEGLRKTGISIDHIPSLEEMNKILSEIGWAAVTVDGFIPPAAFMEFQKYNVLVIAADIRPFNQVEYTPAPDIIHEAAGHAPIIADPEYAEYLRRFGEIGSVAFSSKNDYHLYEIIRHLSILKADPFTPPEKIEEAENCLEAMSKEMGMPSEMALIRNLHWWTVEYGLIGDLENPKIYGAGLLSSIGESKGALKDKVVKIPYSIDAMDYSFDITKPQPQLFVTPDFKHLTKVLNQFANQMGLRKGGIEGIMKAIESGNTATLVYSSGLQVSGTVTDVTVHNGNAVYFKTTGPTTLNFKGKMLEGHSKEYHKDGFGSPIGKIKGTLKPTRFLSTADLQELGIVKGKRVTFEFESGVSVTGELISITRQRGKIILMSFKDCLVTFEGNTLFDPSWGIYDMAVGEKIISAFSGPADAEGFGLSYDPPNEKTHQIQYDEKSRQLHKLYSEIREVRQSKVDFNKINAIWKEVSSSYPNDWLLPVEILELIEKNNINGGLKTQVREYLMEMSSYKPNLKNVISNGLNIAKLNS